MTSSSGWSKLGVTAGAGGLQSPCRSCWEMNTDERADLIRARNAGPAGLRRSYARR